MGEKRLILFCLFALVFAVLLVGIASANFVCGEVNDAGEVTASWFDVNVYYPEFPNKTTSCKISPEGGKYCCDPEAIKGVSWKIGKRVNAEIFDFEKGYVAGPVSLIISGEGFDVFPEMQLDKAITIYSPNSSLIFDVDRVFVNVSLASRFNSLRYIFNSSELVIKENVCFDCNHTEFYIENLTIGFYQLTLIASGADGEINETLFLTNSLKADFGREIECDKCTENYVKEGERVTISVSLNVSHEVKGTLVDYFPVDWTFLESDGVVESFSETHNVIKWEVEGSNIVKQYKLRAPRKIFTRKYIFQSAFEDLLGNEDEIILFRFYRFLSISLKYLERPFARYNYLKYEEISPATPFVIFFKDNNLIEMAIFPKNYTRDVYVFISKNSRERLRDAMLPFTINSNIADDNIEKILIKFKVKKPYSNKYYLVNASLFLYGGESDMWNALNTTPYDMDEDYVYYETYSDKKGTFAIKKYEERVL